MKNKTILLCLLLMLSALSAVSTNEILAKLESTYKGISSWQANVSQTNFFSQINTTSTFDGMIYFTPGRLLIRYDKPRLQRMQIEDGMVSIYDSQSNTLFRTPMLPEFGKMNPVEILQHYWKLSQVKLLKTEKGIHHVSLVPAKDQLIKSLSAQIRSSDGYVLQLGYQDFNGNQVSYKFSNFKRNAAIPASIWKFSYPKDTQIIER